MNNRKVVVTGMGLIVSDCHDYKQLFNDLHDGKSYLKKKLYPAGDESLGFVCSHIDESYLQECLSNSPIYDELNHLSKTTRMALFSVNQAIKDAQLDVSNFKNSNRVGLFVGCNKNIPDEKLSKYLYKNKYINTKSNIKIEDYSIKNWIQNEIENIQPHQATSYVSKYLNISENINTFGDACSAGSAAIVSGARRIAVGDLDVAICGATEFATNEFMQLSFSKLGALYQKSYDSDAMYSRPFDKNRSGCVLSDASAFVILEEQSAVEKRGATPLAVIEGTSRRSQGYHLLSTLADGSFYKQSMMEALQSANLDVCAIDHISAHGTSTHVNDRAESKAIADLFSDNHTVTALKSSLGHSLASSGVVQSILSIEGLSQQKVLPTLNFSQQDPENAALNLVHTGMNQKLNYIMNNSFSFGGENISIIYSNKF